MPSRGSNIWKKSIMKSLHEGLLGTGHLPSFSLKPDLTSRHCVSHRRESETYMSSLQSQLKDERKTRKKASAGLDQSRALLEKALVLNQQLVTKLQGPGTKGPGGDLRQSKGLSSPGTLLPSDKKNKKKARSRTPVGRR